MGDSVWEISVDKQPKTKADSDYANRPSAPSSLRTSHVTYVQVICRPWTKRQQWAEDKSSEGRWREVRAYGVDDIAAWLETAPAATVWLADVLGIPIDGLRTVSQWWDSWTASTSPAIGPEVLLAGRDDQASVMLDRLNAAGGMTTIGGDLRAEEVKAFVAAVAYSTPEARLGLEPSLLFVDDRRTLRRLIRAPQPLVLLLAEPSLASELGPETIHHAVVLTSGDTADILLAPVDSRPVTEALRAEGLDDGRAAELGHLARRSILALRRRLAVRPELHRPSWSAPGAGSLQRRVLLLNTWDEQVGGDCEIVSRLIGTDYSTAEDELLRMAGIPEAPMVANLDGCWHVVSPMDAWLLLGSQLTREDLQRFGDAVREVLGELDPTLELAAEDRWRAALDGVRRRYSASLRRGLANSLALLGFLDDTVDFGSGETGKARASRLVRELLDDANSDASLKLWTSLGDVLPLLAEAAPEAFLDALE